MRIGVDATFLRPEALHTGMGVYTRCLVSALAAIVDEPLVLFGYGPRPVAAPRNAVWSELRRLPAGRLGPWLGHQLALPEAAARQRLDVLHVPGVNLRLSQPGVPLVAPCPLAVTVHDAIPLVYYGREGPPLPWRLRLGYRLVTLAIARADVVVTVSETSRRDIVRHLPVRAERVRVAHNGVDLPAVDDDRVGAVLAGLGVERPYLLYAGSYEPRKNLLGAVAAYRRALARLDLPPMVLLVEPESGYRAAVMAEVERSGVASRLRFVHSLSDVEVAALYRGATLFVYPSHYEGFGFAPLQALAAGVPVVASSAGSLPEVLGDAALFVDPRSVDEIAGGIVRLLTDAAAAGELAARGARQVARYRWDAAARATLDAFRQAAGQRLQPALAL